MFHRPSFPDFRPALLIATATLLASSAAAQQGVERKLLQRQPLPDTAQELVLTQVSVAPGGREGRHRHPGPIAVYLLEGTLRLEIDGQPARSIVAGESVLIGAGVVHEGINEGAVPARAVAALVGVIGKPLAEPAP